MKGFLYMLSIVLFFAFLYYWWKKRSARKAAGGDYKNDDQYKNTSLIKKIIGWGCLISFIGAVAAPIPEEDQVRMGMKQTDTAKTEQTPLTEEQKAAAELQKKYDDQAKYEEWIAWQKSEDEKKAAEELQKKYDDQAKYEEWIAWQKSEEDKKAAAMTQRNANIEKSLSYGWDMEDLDDNSQKNFYKATDIVANQTEYIEQADMEYPNCRDVYQNPAKYYGKIICLKGIVSSMVQEPPGQSLAQYFGGNYFHAVLDGGAEYVGIHIKGRADNIRPGDTITVKGLVTGHTVVTNKTFGGSQKAIMFTGIVAP